MWKVKSFWMKKGRLFWIFLVKITQTEKLIRAELLNGGTTAKAKMPGSEEIDKFKRAGLWDSGILVGKLTIWIRSFKTCNRAHQSIRFIKIGILILMMDIKSSKDKYIVRWVDWKDLIYGKWSSIKDHAQSWSQWLTKGKN